MFVFFHLRFWRRFRSFVHLRRFYFFLLFPFPLVRNRFEPWITLSIARGRADFVPFSCWRLSPLFAATFSGFPAVIVLAALFFSLESSGGCYPLFYGDLDRTPTFPFLFFRSPASLAGAWRLCSHGSRCPTFLSIPRMLVYHFVSDLLPTLSTPGAGRGFFFSEGMRFLVLRPLALLFSGFLEWKRVAALLFYEFACPSCGAFSALSPRLFPNLPPSFLGPGEAPLSLRGRMAPSPLDAFQFFFLLRSLFRVDPFFREQVGSFFFVLWA